MYVLSLLRPDLPADQDGQHEFLRKACSLEELAPLLRFRQQAR